MVYFRVFVFSLLLHSGPVIGAACCTSATAFGTGRLLVWESYAFGIRAQAVQEIGFFDDTGAFDRNDPTQVDQHLRIESYSLFGLFENLSAFVVVPVLFPRIGDGHDVYVGSGLSDIQLGLRHQVIAIGEYEEIPSLALTYAILLPTGTPRTLGTLPHDVTGKNVLSFMMGASFEKTWFPYFVQLNLGNAISINNIRSKQLGVDFSYLVQTSLAAGAELSTTLVIASSAQFHFESSQKYKIDAGLSLSWRFDPHFTAMANLSSDIIVSGFGANLPGSISFGMGLRYGYF